MTADLSQLIRERHSERTAFDPNRPIPAEDLEQLLEAARWAPTAHNMQNFELIVIDEPPLLERISEVRTTVSPEFLQENYAQLAFSEEELRTRGTGLLATLFPSAWRAPAAEPEGYAGVGFGSLGDTMGGCPLVLIVLYDSRRRAPASEGDLLGLISLGCVMQNLWLTAESLGIGMQIMSAFGSEDAEEELREILSIPPHLRIAFAVRLGHPIALPRRYPRVRRELSRFVHRGGYRAGVKAEATPVGAGRHR